MKNKKKKNASVGVDPCVDPKECERCEEYKNGWKRALADYENLQKDLLSQKEGARRSIKIDFAQSLLPVIDNFDQAIAHAPSFHPERAEGESKDLHAWMQGVIFIKKQFGDVLANLGIEHIEVGTEFDPNLHESVGEGEAFKEVRSGWKIPGGSGSGDYVLRPAQVIIKQENKS